MSREKAANEHPNEVLSPARLPQFSGFSIQIKGEDTDRGAQGEETEKILTLCY